MIRGEHDESQLAAREVLLIPDVLVARQQQIEPLSLGRVEQGAVLQPLPAQFIRSHHFMTRQETGQRSRGVGVEKNPHATAAGCSRESLAKARTSCTCSRLTDGNHSRNSAIVEPLSRCSNKVATRRRVPRKHHAPPSLPAFRSTALQRLQCIPLVYRRSALSSRLTSPTEFPTLSTTCQK